MTIHCSVLSPIAQQFIHNKSRRLCRRPGFSRSDADDLRQEMTAYVWAKSPAYDARRGNPEAFVTMLTNSWTAMYLRDRGRAKRCPARPVLSLDTFMVMSQGKLVPLGSTLLLDGDRRRTNVPGLSPEQAAEFHDNLAMVMARTTLAERDLLISVFDHGIAGVARVMGRSRRDVQREVTAIRTRFCTGIADSCAAAHAAA